MEITEIPQAYYYSESIDDDFPDEGFDDTLPTSNIFDDFAAVDGEYSIQIFSPEGGAYNVEVIGCDESGQPEVRFIKGTAAPGSITNLKIRYSASESNPLQAIVRLIEIDIKPGSFPNNINLQNNGVIPVAILTTPTFDATTLDPLSVKFGTKGATESHGKGHIEDADGDGDFDLVLHFKIQEIGIQCGATQVSLSGKTYDGLDLEGTNAIQTVGCGSLKEGSEEGSTIPEKYTLFQNNPNPFNPNTIINFALPEAGKVMVSIYSETGQLVRTLIDNRMPAGRHAVSWNGLNESGKAVAAGFYLYRIVVQKQNGETVFNETRRMTLLK